MGGQCVLLFSFPSMAVWEGKIRGSPARLVESGVEMGFTGRRRWENGRDMIHAATSGRWLYLFPFFFFTSLDDQRWDEGFPKTMLTRA